jgi:predicted AAA+ superfamily ATPase
MKRSYTKLFQAELKNSRQMLFVSGARQVGKTTVMQQIIANKPDHYFNWDNLKHRELIMQGNEAIIARVGADQLADSKPVIVFDELHKFKDWKNWLKGLFDVYENHLQIIVTGSASMDVFRRGGDSLMGRYFHYRMHPLSLREITAEINLNIKLQPLTRPKKEILTKLLQFGGFPEPFLKANQRFSNRWGTLRQQQLIREDIRDGTHIQEIAQLEVLAELLRQQSGDVTRYSTLAKQIRVSIDTIRRWLDVLEGYYYCYRIRPWHQNIATSLRKEPKTYLWDWSKIEGIGKRHENFVASHLLKFVHWLTDLGFGNYQLHYLRTKDQKEVDFIVTENQQPWFLVEVKTSSSQSLNKHLKWFQNKTKAHHAFQVVMDLPFVDANCFEHTQPIKVPVESLLMQLA